MAIFPRSEPDQINLLRIVSSVLETHHKRFPKAASRRQAIERLRASYAEALSSRDDLAEQLRLANEEKDRCLESLVTLLKSEYQRVLDEAQELDGELREEIVEEIEKGLVEQSDRPPAEPRELSGLITAPGVVTLQWRRPRKTKGGRVSSYLIERRSAQTPGQFTEWQFLTTSYVPEITLEGEPTSQILEYRIWSHNKSGRSAESAQLLLAAVA